MLEGQRLSFYKVQIQNSYTNAIKTYGRLHDSSSDINSNFCNQLDI